VGTEGSFAVYIVFESDRPIYVGSTTRGLKRIRNNLMRARNHTLSHKLRVQRFGGKREEVINFLKEKCSFKILHLEDIYFTQALEYFTILKLKPRYNGVSK